MKLIDEYLKTLYQNDESKEILEVKEEMRAHLIESASELKNEGYSEEEAQRCAIKRFDGGTEMIKELHTMLKDSKNENRKITNRFVNTFRNIAIVTLLISAIASLNGTYTQNKWHKISEIVGQEVNKIAMQGTDNEQIYKDTFDELLNSKKFKNVKSLKIYNKTKRVGYEKEENLKYHYIGKNAEIKDNWGSGLLSDKKTKDGYNLYYYIELGSNLDYMFGTIHFPCLAIGVISLTVYIALIISFKYDKRRNEKISS